MFEVFILIIAKVRKMFDAKGCYYIETKEEIDRRSKKVVMPDCVIDSARGKEGGINGSMNSASPNEKVET